MRRKVLPGPGTPGKPGTGDDQGRVLRESDRKLRPRLSLLHDGVVRGDARGDELRRRAAVLRHGDVVNGAADVPRRLSLPRKTTVRRASARYNARRPIRTHTALSAVHCTVRDFVLLER